MAAMVETRAKKTERGTARRTAKVEIYYTRSCPYCIRSLRLLDERRIEFIGIDVGERPSEREEMNRRTPGKTVPQIFINDKPIGGCDELMRLDSENKLEPLLK